MNILYSFILLLGIFIFGGISWRLFREAQLKEASEINQGEPLFQRKLAVIQQKEQTHHILVGLAAIGLLAFGLILLVSTQWRANYHRQSIEGEIKALEQTVEKLEAEQAELLAFPVYEYPKAGIGLADIDWRTFLLQENPEKRFEVEQELAQRITPFLGRATVIVTNNVPMQRLTLTFYSEITEVSALEAIQKNILAFLAEAQKVTELSQINIQIRQRSKETTVFHEVYLRTEEGTLEIVKESDATADTSEASSAEEASDGQTSESSSEKQEQDEDTKDTKEETEQKGAVTGNG